MYYRITEGVRVTVQPVYVPGQSAPHAGRYVFAYRIRIENVGTEPAQLVWRHWYIHDPVAGDSEVEGEGVVGQQPVIAPGGVHEYQSFCVLQAPGGSMEGYYQMVRPDGTRFNAAIPKFILQLPEA